MKAAQMIILAVFGAALGLSGCASSQAACSDRLLDTIEAQIVMPEGAESVAAYTRYYVRLRGAELQAHGWKKEPADGDKVFGVYIVGKPFGRRWETVDHIPVIMDGGCGIVNVVYDVASKSIDMVTCNGVA